MPPNAGRDAHDRLDELVHVLGVDQYRHRRDAGELLVEDRLALHNRHRGDRPDIPEAEHPRSVRADGDAAPDHGKLAGERGVFDDGLARPRYPGRVDVAHVLHGPDRVGRLDHELPALVLEERPVARPHDLDAFQIIQQPDDPLGLVAVFDLQRDLAQRGLTADVYGRRRLRSGRLHRL